MSRMPSVTGHEITSERSIALRFAALKSDHMPGAPVRWTCTPPADSAASRPLSRSAARTISFEPFAAPARTIAVCPSGEIEMPGAGSTTAATARSARRVLWTPATTDRNVRSPTVFVGEETTVIRP